MQETTTKQHIWVKHTITPVHVLQDDDGEPVVIVDPDQIPIAEEAAVYGCDLCGVPLWGYVGSECEGEPLDD